MKNQESKRFYIAVVGANGGIGKQVVEQALKAGHHVTAIVRNPANLRLTHPDLEVVQGDIMHAETIEKHLENKDAVISAIGKNSFKPTTLYSQGNKALLTAMKKAGTTRAFFISASGLDVNPSHSFIVRFATKYILQKLLRNMYADIRIMEQIIQESGIDWTIMRPPRLVDKPVTGRYRVAINHFLKNGLVIARADVAHYMIHHITDTATYRKIVELGY